jgi:type II secretory ATPase GspE/PulE/Tfp pilus assembly ATPase PilB-like protein
VINAPLVVVAPLSRENAKGVMAARNGQWLLATLDTALIGLDVAYPLHGMGIDNETLIDRVRCIWSQFLVARLCADCAVPTGLSPADMDYLFPTEPLLHDPKKEIGCPNCESTRDACWRAAPSASRPTAARSGEIHCFARRT